MRIFIGADHGGFELKKQIISWLSESNYQVEDGGAFSLDPADDYPDFAFAVARKVKLDPEARGILLCRSGAGMVIAANKVNGIRAVAVNNKAEAQHAREHNNANIISVSADWLNLAQIKAIIEVFLQTAFTEDARHVRRLAKIDNFKN